MEVYIDGTWATVCGLYMDFDTANVLCLHMDFSSAIEITKQPTLQGNGSVLDVTCSKGSFLKENCTMKRSDCSHEWDAGLVCQCKQHRQHVLHCIRMCACYNNTVTSFGLVHMVEQKRNYLHVNMEI